MSRAIWKFELEPGSGSKGVPLKTEVPVGAVLLKVGTQGNAIVGWFDCDTEQRKTEPRDFFVVPTGKEPPARDFLYLDTVFMRDPLLGDLVWHVYSRVPQEAF